VDVDALEVRVVFTVGAEEPQPAATTTAMTRRSRIGRFSISGSALVLD